MALRFFLAFFILTSCLVAGQSPKYALKGGMVLMTPDIAGHPDGILWKHNGNKVVESNGKEQQVYSPYDNRIALGWVSAELHITDLRFEDSGDYDLEVDVNKGLHRSTYKLEVVDKVAEPTISCEMNGGSSSNSSAELECSSEPRRPRSLTKFEWRTRGNVQPGPKLTISLGDELDNEVYSCSVSNPLSNETATFTAKDCYPDKSSSVELIAGLSIFVFALLLVGVGLGILFCKRRHKGSDKKKAQGEVNKSLERVTTLPSTQPLHQFYHAPDVDKPAYDMDKQDEMPQKGNVKAKIKLFGKNNGGQTSFKQLRTENHTDEQKRTASPLSPPPSESPTPLDMNNPASNDDSDADADQCRESAEEEVPQYDPSDSEKANEPEPAAVSDKLISEDAQSDLEVSIAPEQPACDVDKQEEEPLKGRSPACDVVKQDEITQLENHPDEHKRTASPPSPPPSESPPTLDLINPASNDDGDADADQRRESAEEEVQHYDPSDSEKANEPEPAGVSDKLSEDAQSDLEVSIASEQPAPDVDKQDERPQKGHVDSVKRKLFEENKGRQTSFKQLQTEPEKEADEDEKPATSETSPAVQPHSPATESSPNMAPEDTAGEHEEDAHSDQVTGGTAEKNVRESDSSEKNASEDKLSSIVPEQRGSKTSLHDMNSQEEAHTNKDNQQETVKPVSEDEHETDKEPDLYLKTSQQPQSPTPTKPDNGNANTPQKSPDAAPADPDRIEEEEEEHKTSHDSEESEGQSDKGEGETVEGKGRSSVA